MQKRKIWVYHFDLNQDNFQDKVVLEKVLERHLVEWEKEYDVEDQADTLAARFQREFDGWEAEYQYTRRLYEKNKLILQSNLII